MMATNRLDNSCSTQLPSSTSTHHTATATTNTPPNPFSDGGNATTANSTNQVVATSDSGSILDAACAVDATPNEPQQQQPLPSSSASSTTTTSNVVSVPEDEWHPASKWQEPCTDKDELTLYDIHREPRQVCFINNNNNNNNNPPGVNMIRCSLKSLDPEFQCVICLQYMMDPMIVMDCLHRFCGDCIQKCLRLGKNECPTCRTPIPSRRSLRKDTKWNNLIQHVLMMRRKQQQQLEEQMATEDAGDRCHNNPNDKSLSLPPSRKRARNLQDAIVEKRNVLLLQKRQAIERQQQQRMQQQQQQQQTHLPMEAKEVNPRENNKEVTAPTNTDTEGRASSNKSNPLQSTSNSPTPIGKGPSVTTNSGTTSPVSPGPDASTKDPSDAAVATSVQQQQQQPPLPSKPSPTDPLPLQVGVLETSPLLDVQLVRYAQERTLEPLSRPYLTLRGDATIAVLKQFLSQKLQYPHAQSFQLLGMVKERLVALNSNMTLFQVRDACRHQPANLHDPRSRNDASPPLASTVTPLVLQYRLAVKQQAPTTLTAQQQRQGQQQQTPHKQPITGGTPTPAAAATVATTIADTATAQPCPCPAPNRLPEGGTPNTAAPISAATECQDGMCARCQAFAIYRAGLTASLTQQQLQQQEQPPLQPLLQQDQEQQQNLLQQQSQQHLPHQEQQQQQEVVTVPPPATTTIPAASGEYLNGDDRVDSVMADSGVRGKLTKPQHDFRNICKCPYCLARVQEKMLGPQDANKSPKRIDSHGDY